VAPPTVPPPLPPLPARGGWTPDVAGYLLARRPALPAGGRGTGPPTASPESVSQELTWPDVDPDGDPATGLRPDSSSYRPRAVAARPPGPPVADLPVAALRTPTPTPTPTPAPARQPPPSTRPSPPPSVPSAAARGSAAGVPLVVASRRIVVGGFGGGCGRTTVTAGVGMALAHTRGERVAAVDACPDQNGSLAARAGGGRSTAGIRDLVAARGTLTSLAEVRRFLVTGPTAGLAVLPGLGDLGGPGLTADEAGSAVEELARWYPVVLVDAPPGWSQPVPARLIGEADALLLVCRAATADLAAADSALTALRQAGRADLAGTSVVAVVATRPGRWSHDARRQMASLGGYVASVVGVPYDASLADGRACSWNRLRRRTRNAFDHLATALDGAGRDAAGLGAIGFGGAGVSGRQAAGTGGTGGTGLSGATTLAG
jgi:MinD-like ATPase involved in chromosome partitioning or flagellar assembly